MRQAMAAAPDRKPTVERAAALRQETVGHRAIQSSGFI